MNGKWMFRFVVCVTVFGGCAAASLAAPPWGDLISLKSVAADPEQTYQINENNGPWTILACSFSGEGAEKQANELVYELRKRYKLPAYVHKAGFDLGDAAGKGSTSSATRASSSTSSSRNATSRCRKWRCWSATTAVPKIPRPKRR